MIPINLEINGPESRLVGYLPDDVVRYLRSQLSYQVKDAFFSDAFQERRWDGRKHLFTESTHKFASGLVARVKEALTVVGYEATLIDTRAPSEPSHFMPHRSTPKLYDYQIEAVEKAIHYQNGMIRIATGGGKTLVGATIISELERPAVFLVHRNDLLLQVKEVLCGRDGEPGYLLYPELVGQIGNGVFEPNLITIMTVQTACAALGITITDKMTDEHDGPPRERLPHKAEQMVREVLLGAEVMELDEAHHAPASTIYEIMQEMKNARWRLGLSATDWRDDNSDLMIEAATGPRIVNISLSDLISWDRLVPAHVTMEELPSPELGGWDANSWQSVYSAKIVNNQELNERVVAVNQEWLNAGRTVLTLVKAIKHGVTLKRMHKALGIESVFISGQDGAERRKDILDKVKAGKLHHIIATSVADEGLDLPVLDALNLAGGGKSSTLAYQRIGRVLRKYGNKTEGLVHDYDVDDPWLSKHAGIRRRIYKKEKGFKVL